jgi:hypothetical protein
MTFLIQLVRLASALIELYTLMRQHHVFESIKHLLMLLK